MANQAGDSVFTKKVTCTTGNQKLDMVTSRNVVTLIADGDCFINFDAAVTSDERMLLKANTYYYMDDVMVTQLNYLDAGGGANIYVMAVKSA